MEPLQHQSADDIITTVCLCAALPREWLKPSMYTFASRAGGVLAAVLNDKDSFCFEKTKCITLAVLGQFEMMILGKNPSFSQR